MKGRIRSRLRWPSPALVVGCTAVVLALGGTATALDGTDTVELDDMQDNSVGHTNIKTNAIRRSEIKDGAVQNAELGTIVVRTATNAVPDGAFGRAEAECADGEQIIGGGGYSQQSVADARYLGDHPSTGGGIAATDGNDFDAWNAKLHNEVIAGAGNNVTIDLVGYAICLQ